jgi:hypothetical protein
MFNGSKQMKRLYLLGIVFFLIFGCDDETQIQPRSVHLYFYNNSNETALIIGYQDDDPETVFQELQIFPDQVREVGFIKYRSKTGLIYESDRLEVYNGNTLIYDVEDMEGYVFSKFFEDAVEQKMEDYYIRAAPLFKWCGNELCEEQ